MKVKEYLGKISLSTKILGAIIIGSFLLLLVLNAYQNRQQTLANQAVEATERQEQINAAKAQQESEERQKKIQEMIDRMEQERLQRQTLNELRGIRDSLEKMHR